MMILRDLREHYELMYVHMYQLYRKVKANEGTSVVHGARCCIISEAATNGLRHRIRRTNHASPEPS